VASIIACPPPVADFTGRADLHANGNIVGVYRDAEGAEYLRVAPAADIRGLTARWYRIVTEAAPDYESRKMADDPGPLGDPDFGDPPAPEFLEGALPDELARFRAERDADRDAEHLRLMRETVRCLEYEYEGVRERLADFLREHIMCTLSWLSSRIDEVCQSCGCRRLTEVTVRSLTGVRAPDGTRESGECTATICERCGAVAGGDA
jgi:hypothetical protein